MAQQGSAILEKNAEEYWLSGDAKLQQNQSEQAIADYTQAIELDPNNAGVYFNRGVANETLNQYGEAIKDYTQAIGIDPSNAVAYFNRGVAKENLNQFEEAIITYCLTQIIWKWFVQANLTPLKGRQQKTLK